MTILVSIIVILALLMILGLDIMYILSGVIILLCLISGAIVVFFIVSMTLLVTSKSCEGELSEIRKDGKNPFDSVFYLVNGKEYKNIFPCETVMRKQLYKKGKHIKLRYAKSIDRVFDLNAVICTIAGVILGTVSLLGMVSNAMGFFNSVF